MRAHETVGIVESEELSESDCVVEGNVSAEDPNRPCSSIEQVHTVDVESHPLVLALQKAVLISESQVECLLFICI